ncbi:MAG: NAD(P)H-hydrate dehydratase [Rhodovulum sp.]
MSEILTSAQMRATERAMIESGFASGLDLMERAGRCVVEAVFNEWPSLAAEPQHALVLCGPGNNGGDGFVVARLLRNWGWQVETFLLGPADRLPRDARTNHDRWLATGGRIARLPFEAVPDVESAEPLIVDALFGTGLTRPLGADLVQGVLAPLEGSGYAGARRVAIDVPSGVCSDSGRVLTSDKSGGAFRAELTVSFHRLKPAHVLSEGPALCGRVVLADIGLTSKCKADHAQMLDEPALHARRLRKPANGHKYTSGHVLILSGGAGRTGAARLAARGALRIGAGLVTVGAPAAAIPEIAAHLTAIMLRQCDDAKNLVDLLQDMRFNALCLGPGLGTDARGAALLRAALASRRPMVLDADALTLLVDDKDLQETLHERCVLTPHMGEFARLFPLLAAELGARPSRGPARSKLDAARRAAARTGAVVLIKGPDTVIAAPDGRCSISAAVYDRAVPWLATAGAGDVLSGMIAGLLARGLAPMAAAETAAWLHVEAARSFGPGLVAEDLPEMLPKVFRDLGL